MNPMIEVEQPYGGRGSVPLATFVDRLETARRSVSPAFSAERLELVSGVSAGILAGGSGRSDPGVTHFAYWTRRQALRALARDHLGRLPPNCLARPRGLVFHLPPQNVETVFLYSWVISYLCGNANLVRLPTELAPAMQELLNRFQLALSAAGDSGQLFVRYGATEATNRALSSVSDARVVWGGDAKIHAFEALPLREGGKAIWFGDRRSLAVADGVALCALEETAVKELAERLHNDIFVFDQMACSSPVRLFVVGDQQACEWGVDRLLDVLSTVAMSRGSVPATGHVIRKMVVSMALAASGKARGVTRHSNSLTTLLTDQAADRPPVGGGFLEVSYVACLAEVARRLEENVQTIVHAGFVQDTLEVFAASLRPFGVTRIVPMGQALDFDAVWDGYDLFSELTRLLRVR